MNHEEENQEMTTLTLGSNNQANASPEASESNTTNNTENTNTNTNNLSLLSPAFEPGSSSNNSGQPNGEGSGEIGGVGPTSLRYKGVVPQLNGHWGAQIYANHQRIWLGTFKTENEAALAYDRASIKLRSGDSYKNLAMTPEMLAMESNFQSIHSTAAVLIMIKDGSYPNKLAEFCRTCQFHPGFGSQPRVMSFGGGVYGNTGGDVIVQTDSFEKELTPSDVGKLNRLVIPKKYATKFFPYLCHIEGEGLGNSDLADTEVDVFDEAMRCWKFRYCYWRSSQSFVFTKGWNKFVKDKGLKTKDVVLFYKCEQRPGPASGRKPMEFLMIDVRYSPPLLDDVQPQVEGAGVEANGEGPSRVAEEVEGQQSSGEGEEEAEVNEGEEEDVEVEEERRVIKLFGVEIDPNENA